MFTNVSYYVNTMLRNTMVDLYPRSKTLCTGGPGKRTLSCSINNPGLLTKSVVNIINNKNMVLRFYRELSAASAFLVVFSYCI